MSASRLISLLRDEFRKLLDNPIVSKEMRLFVRGRGNLAALAIFLLLFLMVALSFVEFQLREPRAHDAGLSYTMTLLGLLSLCLMVIVPNRAAAAIAQEKEKRTLDLLLTTLLSPREIVLGKLFYPLGLFALLVFLALPFFPLGLFLGGISPWTLLWLVFGISLLALFLSAGAILLSSYVQKTVTVTGGIYGASLLFFFFGGIPLAVLLGTQGVQHVVGFNALVWLGVLSLLWWTFFFLEKAADNLLSPGLRKPRYFKKIFLGGYFLSLAAALFYLAGNPSADSLGTFFQLFSLGHFFLLVIFPALARLAFWESFYVPILAAIALLLVVFLAVPQKIWKIPALLSSFAILADLLVFSVLSYRFSLSGRVEGARRGLLICGGVVLVGFVLTAILSVAWTTKGDLYLPFPLMATLSIWGRSLGSLQASPPLVKQLLIPRAFYFLAVSLITWATRRKGTRMESARAGQPSPY